MRHALAFEAARLTPLAHLVAQESREKRHVVLRLFAAGETENILVIERHAGEAVKRLDEGVLRIRAPEPVAEAKIFFMARRFGDDAGKQLRANVRIDA